MPHCDKKLSAKNKADSHIRRFHTDERPFLCEICMVGYASLDSVKYHLLAHTRKPNFVLIYCEMCSEKRLDFSKHLLEEHTSDVIF